MQKVFSSCVVPLSTKSTQLWEAQDYVLVSSFLPSMQEILIQMAH